MLKRLRFQEAIRLSHELLRRILKGRTITALELHQQLADASFERSMRTIQRQLEILSEIYGIDRDDSTNPYRYCWKERVKGLSLHHSVHRNHCSPYMPIRRCWSGG